MLMNEERAVLRNGKLVAAGAVTLTVALVMVWAGWRLTGIGHSWDDLTSADHWLGVLLRGGGALLLGKTGLKIGFVVVGVVAGTVMWMRGRRRHH
ncbi:MULTISPECIES: hypothetical protein [Catenuloplanes]|uniref:Uncharacterized protein n=1 Tax=Catenuloplanes niger TaxID=587534 RepID=A0AAE4CQR5_9ACTN|nr:hypothetical protein [Catenuloplanes niger]MDR7322076.1 hypothetical protein [Catenuloplanes niger]